MAREKLFYTSDQIIENLYTTGNEYQLADDSMYVGLFHRYNTGEIYTESTWNPGKSKKLVLFVSESNQIKTYKKNKSNIQTRFDSIQQYNITVSPTDVQNKYINRYFLYKINEQTLTEIDLQQYNHWYSGQLDNNIYNVIEIIWYIAGPAEDIITGNIVSIGVIQKNQTTINRVNQEYPGFNRVVSNPAELYVDTTVYVPPPIN